MSNLELYSKIIGLAVICATLVGIFAGIALYWLKDKFVTKEVFNQHITAHASDITSLKGSQLETKYEIKQFADKIESLKEWISDKLKQQDTNTIKELMHINDNIKQYIDSNNNVINKVAQLEDKVQEIEIMIASHK